MIIMFEYITLLISLYSQSKFKDTCLYVPKLGLNNKTKSHQSPYQETDSIY